MVTAPDGARAERVKVKETAVPSTIRSRHHAATGAGLFDAAGASQLRGSEVPPFHPTRVYCQWRRGARFATVEVATQCDVGVGTVDAGEFGGAESRLRDAVRLR